MLTKLALENRFKKKSSGWIPCRMSNFKANFEDDSQGLNLKKLILF